MPDEATARARLSQLAVDGDLAAPVSAKCSKREHRTASAFHVRQIVLRDL